MASHFLRQHTVLGSTVISSIAQQPPASAFLITSVQMLSQEFFRRHYNAMLFTVRESHGLRRARADIPRIARFAQRDHELGHLALFTRGSFAPWTTSRVGDLVCVCERRALGQQRLCLPGVFDRPCARKTLAIGSQYGGIGFQQGNQVGWTDNVNRGGVSVRSKRKACECGVAAYETAQNSHLLGSANAPPTTRYFSAPG